MNYLIYVSTARKPMTETELLEILTQSRQNNEQFGITGVLLYSAGTFIQLLEGEAESVNKIYSWILKDTRHKNIIKLTEASGMARSFPDWTMGFRSINEEQLKTIRGYFDVKNASFDAPHPGVQIIRGFAESNPY